MAINQPVTTTTQIGVANLLNEGYAEQADLVNAMLPLITDGLVATGTGAPSSIPVDGVPAFYINTSTNPNTLYVWDATFPPGAWTLVNSQTLGNRVPATGSFFAIVNPSVDSGAQVTAPIDPAAFGVPATAKSIQVQGLFILLSNGTQTVDRGAYLNIIQGGVTYAVGSVIHYDSQIGSRYDYIPQHIILANAPFTVQYSSAGEVNGIVDSQQYVVLTAYTSGV